MSKVVMIIAPDGFRDEEYFEPKAVFEAGEIQVVTASKQKGPCYGKLGRVAMADIVISEIEPEEYDAVVFVGGPGMAKLINDPEMMGVAKVFSKMGKIIGAICVAPSILANAGLLKNKKATAFSSEEGYLMQKGAMYTGKPVEAAGKIITANGPAAAREFGKAIVKALKG